MPSTSSAKKALRQSKRKKAHNLYWKRRIKSVVKTIKRQLSSKSVNVDILKDEERLLYKVVDKAAKENVIHKNKAKRIKSKISKEISAHGKNTKRKSNVEPKPSKAKRAST